jgi:tripartite-type tricarboxylate transporter receptor subunit TctC
MWTRRAQRSASFPESKKNPNYPEVPTLKELGYDFSNDTFFNILGPAGVPPDVINKLESTFAKAAESKEVKAVIDKLDIPPVLYVGKEYGEHLKSY